MVHVTWPRFLQGWFHLFAIHGLALATINLSGKFKASISTHYKDMKGDTKYRKLGTSGSLNVTENSAIR